VDLRPVQMASRESRMPVAVLAFAGQNLDSSLNEMLRVSTEAQMVAQERFRVLDRTRLQDVLTEQQLSAALDDSDRAIALGKLTTAHVFLVADVFARDQQGIEVKARAISTETSDVVATLDVYIPDPNDSAGIQKACSDLAYQLAQVFPRVSGEVIAVRSKGGRSELMLNWTTEDAVREGAYVLVVHEDEPWISEDTGEVLEPGEFIEVGRAKVVSVRESGSRARTVESNKEGVKLEKGMPAITM